MNYGNLLSRLDTEEGKKKAESLFSKKFIEYLSSKKSTTSIKRTLPRSYNPSVSLLAKHKPVSPDASQSLKKDEKKIEEGSSFSDYQREHRNKLTQCSLLQTPEELSPPEELRQLLINMTILLQELNAPCPELNKMFDLITRITILVREFIRKPLKKITDDGMGNYAKNVEKTIAELDTLLDDYKNGLALEPDNGLREYKRIEREIANRNEEIVELKKNISDVEWKLDFKTDDITERVKNSILANEKLKNEIKFNRGQLKRYKKILMEKEWSKRKIESELTHLKKKSSKTDFSDEYIDKFISFESDTEKKNLPKRNTPNSGRTKRKSSREKTKLDLKTK